MEQSDLKFIQDWKETRKYGWIKFSLIHGSIFGIITFILTKLLTLIFEPSSGLLLNQGLHIEILVWLIGGILMYGPIMWKLNEYLFEKRTSGLSKNGDLH